MAGKSGRQAKEAPSGDACSQATELWNKKDFQSCSKAINNVDEKDQEVKNNLFAVEAILTDWNAEKPEAQARLQEQFRSLSESEELKGLSSAETLPGSAVLLVNTATVLSHCGQHEAAQKLLEPVWQALQAGKLQVGADEELLLGACFTLIEANFALKRHAQISGMLAWLARLYDLGGEEEGEGEARGGSALEATNSSVHSLDLATSPGSPRHTDQASKVVGGYDISSLLLCWRARLHLRTGNLRAAKSSIRSLLALHPRHDQSMSLKAELEALRGNLRRAGKLVAAGVPEEGGSLHGGEAVQALCNMGCVQHCEGKHRSALFCYSRALEAASALRSQLVPAVDRGDAKITGVEHMQGVEVALLYNAGLQALQTGHFDTALESFQRCAVAEPWEPLTWLRMAECCVGASLAGVPLPHVANPSPAGEGAAGQRQAMTTTEALQHGSQCASNAVLLFDKLMAEEGAARDGDRPRSGEGAAAAGEKHAPLQAGKLAALACAAFLSLQLSQPDVALQLTEQILQGSRAGSPEWQIGQTYASEALNLLGRAPDAVHHLHSALNSILDAELPSSPQEVKQAGDSVPESTPLESLAELRSTKLPLLINLASTYFSAGDVRQAHDFAVAAADEERRMEAVMMRAYMELCTGSTAAAISQLRAFQLGVDATPRIKS